jgi:hypothetical protein
MNVLTCKDYEKHELITLDAAVTASKDMAAHCALPNTMTARFVISKFEPTNTRKKKVHVAALQCKVTTSFV